MPEFNFDEWARLYESSPDEYEQRRAEFLQECIKTYPVEQRNMLRMLQLAVDVIRQTHSPEESFVIISGMMSKKLSELQDNLKELQQILEDSNRD